ncbi:MAG: hypothetical protein HS101_11605 [Planctomycetia bacterium]|nr:hypothetical protein [Planctomycetia bacterium]
MRRYSAGGSEPRSVGCAKRQAAARHWHATEANVAVETDAAGNLKPSKKKSTERIDGIVATVIGLGRALLEEGECNPRVFLILW